MALKPCRECGREVSTNAKECPNCGTPNPTKSLGGTDIGCGSGCMLLILGVIVIGIISAALDGGDSNSSSDAQAHANRALATLDGPPVLTRYTWGTVNIRSGPGTDHNPVRQAEAKSALLLLKATDGWHPVIADRTARDTTGWVHESVVHTERNTPAEKEQAAATARRAFAKLLENNYLDEGLDIHVTTHGRNATTLRLEYVLFGRVWAHQFSEGEHWGTIRDLGFKRVEMRDGYDFSWAWTL